MNVKNQWIFAWKRKDPLNDFEFANISSSSKF